ncbi:MAG: hypothetical protein IJL93_03000 [Bacteroidales bacterium]|nr:hypothetical protein [Bacteroidales bacterium]
MKKIFIALLALSCLMAAPATKAQTINVNYPNELSFSYGVSLIGSATSSLVARFDILQQFSDGEYVKIQSGGSKGVLNLGYVYHTSKLFGVGGNFGFNRMSVTMEDETGKMTAASANVFFLMADAKLNWFRRDIFGMYSKLGLGVMCINTSLAEEAGGNLWLPTGHLSLVGMELGRQFCGFMELGAGMQGIVQFGVKYHF